MKYYDLSEYGKRLTYKTWRNIGGCALPNNTMAMVCEDSTLGDISYQCPYSGRSLARFAAEHLKMECFYVEKVLT